MNIKEKISFAMVVWISLVVGGNVGADMITDPTLSGTLLGISNPASAFAIVITGWILLDRFVFVDPSI